MIELILGRYENGSVMSIGDHVEHGHVKGQSNDPNQIRLLQENEALSFPVVFDLIWSNRSCSQFKEHRQVQGSGCVGEAVKAFNQFRLTGCLGWKRHGLFWESLDTLNPEPATAIR